MTRILVAGTFSLMLFFSNAQNFFPVEIYSKSYFSLKNADSLFDIGEYSIATKYYNNSSPIIDYFPLELYKHSICLWITKDSIGARDIFLKAVGTGLYFSDLSYLEQSPFIKELSNGDSLYSVIKQRVYKDSLCLFPKFRDELLKLKERDQFQRVQESLSDYNFKVNDSLNRIALTNILDSISWPGFNEVGYMGEGAAFLIAQHSDNDSVFQRKSLLLMRDQFLKGNISISSFAMIIDRYLINQGECQIFGTQVIFNDKENTFELKKCKYPSEIDFLRNLFMLVPLKDYINMMNNQKKG